MSTNGSGKRVRLTADARRAMIVQAALRAVAAEGFEGLRTRDIAASVDITSATLHHHFPTKADLVSAVADELKTRFQSQKAPAASNSARSANPAIAALEGQFADAEYYRTRHPELIAAYREFVARAPRDPLIARLVRQLNETWRQDILRILERLRDEALLGPDLDPELGSHIVLHTLWGLSASSRSARITRDLSARLLAFLVPPSRPSTPRAVRGRSAG